MPKQHVAVLLAARLLYTPERHYQVAEMPLMPLSLEGPIKEHYEHGFMTFEGQYVPGNAELFNSRLLPTNTLWLCGEAE